MEWRVNLQWKLTEDDEQSFDRSKRMDQIAEKYNEYMTDGGSGFGFGQRDMDWSFNSDAIAHECMQAMMVDLHNQEFKQDPRSFDDTLEWLEKHNIDIYITEINPEDYE